ncbi:hypothetical protein LINPERHAP1_LOCUS36365 [Linum perenne]
MEEAATNSELLNSLKRKSDDRGWNYGTIADPVNKDKIKCNFCDHVSTGGIYRLKAHIGNVGNSVRACKKAPPEAVQACKSAIEGSAKKKKEKLMREQGLRDDVNVSSKHQEEDVTCVAVSFNAIDNDEFKQMCEAIGRFGPGLKPPTQYDLREPLLKSEYARTKSLLKDRDEEKIQNGCSLMTDAWTDMKRSSIMNIVTNCAEGTSGVELPTQVTSSSWCLEETLTSSLRPCSRMSFSFFFFADPSIALLQAWTASGGAFLQALTEFPTLPMCALRR